MSQFKKDQYLICLSTTQRFGQQGPWEGQEGAGLQLSYERPWQVKNTLTDWGNHGTQYTDIIRARAGNL